MVSLPIYGTCHVELDLGGNALVCSKNLQEVRELLAH